MPPVRSAQSRIWGGSRYGVYTKSPQTRLYSESYAGGKVPEAVDAAGFDAMLFYGKAARPTVVSVYPDGAQFFDAGDLWGADTFVTEAEVKKRFAIQKEGYRKPGAVVIGPAGEKLLRFAVIENDKWRSAGRTGVGAVMGSKLLKAVVFQGDARRSFYDADAVAEYAKAFSKANAEHPGVKAYKASGHHHDGRHHEQGPGVPDALLGGGNLRTLGKDQRSDHAPGT